MTRCISISCFALALGALVPAATTQQTAAIDCRGVADCRTQTEAAIAQGDYERAHDLAWRAVQQGRRNDPALMYLLARTQALSGRPDDALVMLGRLAELGVAADASAAEFRRTRDLPGWPAIEASIVRVATRGAAARPENPTKPAAAAAVANPASRGNTSSPPAHAAPAVAVVEAVERASIEDAGRFSSAAFAPGGLACDAVSKRFVFGDRPGRKLQILVDGGNHPVDLTRAVSAGFHDVMALDIDTTNGTLWVASAAADGQVATLHKLQLISGRALASYDVPSSLAPVRPIDVAVTPSGAVLVLDEAQRRVFTLRPGAAGLELLADLSDDPPTSLAVGSHDGVAYVARRGGLSAIDLRTRVVTPVVGSKGLMIGGIERLRRFRSGLVGAQRLPNASRRLVHLVFDGAGRVVTDVKVIDTQVPAGADATFAVCGEALVFLARGIGDDAAGEWTIRRVRLNP